MKLSDAQRLFYDVLRGTLPPAGTEVDAVFVGSEALPAAERLLVYRRMYIHRQRDALAEDFPKTAALLGHDGFDALFSAYLREHPSDNPDLGRFGRRLPDFLRTPPARACSSERPDLPDMAALEWVRAEVFDEAPSDTAQAADLQALGPERFALARLRLIPALRRLSLAFDVAEHWRRLEAGEAPGPPIPGPVAMVVWRQGFDVYHSVVTADEATALSCAAEGRPLGEICAAFSRRPSPAEAAFGALTSWLADRWVAAVTMDGP